MGLPETFEPLTTKPISIVIIIIIIVSFRDRQNEINNFNDLNNDKLTILPPASPRAFTLNRLLSLFVLYVYDLFDYV